MSEVVQKGLIMIDQEFKEKEGAIQSLISRALASGKISFIKRYFNEKKKYQLRLVIQLQFPMESQKLF